MGTDAPTLNGILFTSTLKSSALYQSDVLKQMVTRAIIILGPVSYNFDIEMQIYLKISKYMYMRGSGWGGGWGGGRTAGSGIL